MLTTILLDSWSPDNLLCAKFKIAIKHTYFVNLKNMTCTVFVFSDISNLIMKNNIRHIFPPTMRSWKFSSARSHNVWLNVVNLCISLFNSALRNCLGSFSYTFDLTKPHKKKLHKVGWHDLAVHCCEITRSGKILCNEATVTNRTML